MTKDTRPLSGASTSHIDRHVGARMRARRIECGIEPSAMCQALSITLGELMAWEEGRVRPPGTNLLEVANLLSVSPRSFFDELRDDDGTTT